MTRAAERASARKQARGEQPMDPMASQGAAKTDAPVLIATVPDEADPVAKAEAEAAAHMQASLTSAAKGPPPSRPDPILISHPVVWRLRDASLLPRSMGEVRQALLSISCMNAPAEVTRYKAELLGWVDAMEAYHAPESSAS